MIDQTQTESHGMQEAAETRPGAVVVLAQGRVCWEPFLLTQGGLRLGRDLLAARDLADGKVSREHVQIKRSVGVWFIEDLNSKNGTFVNGHRITSAVVHELPRVLRVGSTVLLLVDDVSTGVESGTVVLGPQMQRLRACVEQQAHLSVSLLVVGETGTGKERIARWFHEAGPFPSGPFVAVNGAAVPRELTERLFFGAARGAYSGATSSDGYAQAADRGTLFLDEIGEMDLASQAKLLRLLETREVVRLGEQRGSKVDLRVVAATNQDIHRRVQEGQFRADLYYRLAQPELAVPPLRQRPEEIPYLLEQYAPAVLGAAQPSGAGMRFLERCLLHRWPGNIRELRSVAQEASSRLRADGAASLDALVPAPAPLPPADTSSTDGEDAPLALDRQRVESVLRSCQGNISRAANQLSIHRSKLRRFLQREKIAFDDTDR